MRKYASTPELERNLIMIDEILTSKIYIMVVFKHLSPSFFKGVSDDTKFLSNNI